MWKAILWDIDNTLLDFTLAESNSLRACFKKFGLGECTDEMVKMYSKINSEYWEKLERGEMTKQEILEGRFIEFLSNLCLDPWLAEKINSEFEEGLVNTVAFIENAYELVSSLKGIYKQYAVTNGAYKIQTKKLKTSRLDTVFDDVFISDAVGFEKPSIEFFNYVVANIIPCKKDEILIVGDSLTSDMKGGNNIGIKCCWYNPAYAENTKDLKIDYEIHTLNEILQIV